MRYEVNTSEDFELRAPSSTLCATQELCLEYEIRSAGEFVFNYGLFPEDKNDKDFDETFKVFDPNDEETSALLSSSLEQMEKIGAKKGQLITYEIKL